MIKAKSLQQEYTLIWSGDPSLKLPENEKERETALRVARQTGNWEPLILDGQRPTLFNVRPMPGTDWSWLVSEMNRERFSTLEFCELALRLALNSITNFGEHSVKHSTVEGRTMATKATIDALYLVGEDGAAGRDLVIELGGIVIEHASEQISPLA